MNNHKKKAGQIIPFSEKGEYYYERAVAYYERNNLFKAKKYFLRAVKCNDRDVAYVYRLAAVLAELGEYEESNKWLSHLLSDVDPDYTDCYFYLANNYAFLGRFDQAEKEALRYLEHEPNGEFAEDARELLYEIRIELGRDGDSSREEAVWIDEHEKVSEWMKAGDFDQAIAALKQLIEVQPDFWPAYNNLALAYFYSGNEQLAFFTLEQLLEKNPGNLHAICNLALFFHFLGLKKYSDRLKERLKHVYPVYDDQRYKLGSTFALLHEHDLAFMWLSSVRHSSQKEDLPYYHWLAVSAFMTGRRQTARSAWEHVLKLDPDGKVAPYYLKKMEDGTLNSDTVDYHYRLPEKNESYVEFLKDGVTSSEKFTLALSYILKKYFQRESDATLKDICETAEAPLELKELAACVILMREPRNSVVIIDEDREILYKREADVPKTVRNSLKVLDRLHQMLDSGGMNDLVYQVWSLVYRYACAHSLSFSNINAWSAAIEYVWRHKNGDRATQKAIASIHHVSPATVSKYVQKLKTILY